jgi:hypothetical protein
MYTQYNNINSKLIAIFVLLVCSCLLYGCSGTSNNSSTNQPITTNSAQAKISITWPSSTTAKSSIIHPALIPQASNSIVITISNGSTQITSKTVAKPSSGNTSTVNFDALPAGSLTVTATAYPNADGSGVAQASGTAALATVVGQTSTMTLTMGSTIDHITITSSALGVGAGKTLILTPTAYDASGAVVLVGSTWQWQSSDTSLATVDISSGVVTGVAIGTTTISATESESGKTLSKEVKVLSPADAQVLDVFGVMPWDFLTTPTDLNIYDISGGGSCIVASTPGGCPTNSGYCVVATDLFNATTACTSVIQPNGASYYRSDLGVDSTGSIPPSGKYYEVDQFGTAVTPRCSILFDYNGLQRINCALVSFKKPTSSTVFTEMSGD